MEYVKLLLGECLNVIKDEFFVVGILLMFCKIVPVRLAYTVVQY